MKRWFEPLRTAWVGVITHKLRSFLTILGVVIGVAAVIALMSVGKGASATILSSFQSLGSNLLFVQPGTTVGMGNIRTTSSATTLTEEDGEAIAAQISNVNLVAASTTTFMQAVAAGQNLGVMVVGITPDYQDVYKLQMAEGSYIQQNQYESAQKVAVLGSGAKDYLFPDDDPVGQQLRLGNSLFRVIGVLQPRGQSLMGSNDNSILVPLTTLQQMVSRVLTSRGEHVVSSIVVSVSSEKDIEQVTNDITDLLRSRHRIALGADNDFQITSVQQLTEQISQVTGTLTLMLGAIAAISLLVGGIGVMNIMLVSVVERTREIGIRKALGAREKDIWGQFVIEAAFMTLVGGVIGVLTGWGASRMIARFAQLNTLVSADIVVLAVTVSAAIGLFFGFYPAWQASRLNPIEALRHE